MHSSMEIASNNNQFNSRFNHINISPFFRRVNILDGAQPHLVRSTNSGQMNYTHALNIKLCLLKLHPTLYQRWSFKNKQLSNYIRFSPFTDDCLSIVEVTILIIIVIAIKLVTCLNFNHVYVITCQTL